MKRLTLALIAPLALLGGCQQTEKAAPDDPKAFKVKLAVEPRGDGPIQRLILPAEALIAVQRPDLGDMRLFDGRGKPVPLARADGDQQTSETTTVTAIPVLGSAASNGGSMRIVIDGNKIGHMVSVGVSQGQDAGASRTVAALLDTRAIKDPVSAIALDADLPLQQPVTVTLESSADLAQWQPLAEKVLFRGGQGGQLLGTSKIALTGEELKDRYVRVSWGDSPGVTIRGAEVTSAHAAPLPRLEVEGQGMVLEDAHRARFSVRFAAPIAALRLTETAPDGVVPVRVYGRNSEQEQWLLVGAGTLRQGDKGSLVDLGGTSWRDYRIEADARSAGFAKPPRIELLLEPVELIAALNQSPPYVLALGARQAQPSWFQTSEIAPDDTPDRANLPIARIDLTGAPAPAIKVAPEAESPFDMRKLALWAALLAATAILAFAAIRLARSGERTPSG